jgi:hypothetical protein
MLIDAAALTTFEVSDDGPAVRLNLEGRDGRAVTVVLALPCVTSLIMTLPAIQVQALRAAYRDPSMRVAYPAERWALERSSDEGCLLLTLSTPDGFQVCFSLESTALAAMARAAASPDSLRAPPPAALH